MQRAVVVVLCLMLPAGVALGQERENYGQTGERDYDAVSQFNFFWAQPEGDFAEQIDATPVGVNFLFGGRVPETPLILGTELGYLNYGKQERLDLYQLEDVPVEAAVSRHSQNVLMGHLVARLQLPTGIARPFVDGLAGMKYFVTRSSIRSDVVVFPRGLLASARRTDWAMSYGVGGGVDLRFYTGTFGIYDRPGSVSLTFGVRYLFGEEAEYVTEGFFDEARGVFDIVSDRSRTDMLLGQIGIRFDL